MHPNKTYTKVVCIYFRRLCFRKKGICLEKFRFEAFNKNLNYRLLPEHCDCMRNDAHICGWESTYILLSKKIILIK